MNILDEKSAKHQPPPPTPSNYGNVPLDVAQGALVDVEGLRAGLAALVEGGGEGSLVRCSKVGRSLAKNWGMPVGLARLARAYSRGLSE